MIKAGRAVHCAVKLRLASDGLPASARGNFIDKAGIQIGIDRHLLSRERVQREARGDFRGAHGTVTNHQKLDCDEGEK